MSYGKAAGLLFAAGRSTRMEGGHKLAMRFGATPIVRLAALCLLRGGVDRVFAVVGPDDAGVREALANLPVTFVLNREPVLGMSSSLRAGIAAIPADFGAVVMLPGDMPKVRPATVENLFSALARPGISAAAPYHHGKRGNPVAFMLAAHRDALLALTGDKGAREFLPSIAAVTAPVEVADPGILLDIDTREELRALSEVRGLNVLVRGAGEMATGIAKRLFASGLRVALTETSSPFAVRRKVSFCEAVFDGEAVVEGVACVKVASATEFDSVIRAGKIPLLVDPDMNSLAAWSPDVLIDATIAKRNYGLTIDLAPLVIAFGPGFSAGRDAHVVIETNRGHDLGRLIYQGEAEPDTGAPAPVMGFAGERVLRAPKAGRFAAVLDIGALVESGDLVATIDGTPVPAAIRGVLRGLIRDGSIVREGLKIGDIDPVGNVAACFSISDKARALGGAALEAILAAFNR